MYLWGQEGELPSLFRLVVSFSSQHNPMGRRLGYLCIIHLSPQADVLLGEKTMWAIYSNMEFNGRTNNLLACIPIYLIYFL